MDTPRYSRLVDVTLVEKLVRDLDFQYLVLDQIGDVAVVADLDGNTAFANETACQFLGLPREEIVGKPADLYSPIFPQGVRPRDVVEMAMARGEWRGEMTMNLPDGRTIFWDCRAWLVKDSEGQPSSVCAVATDVTEHHTMREALRASRERFESIFRSASTGVAFSDGEGHIEESNETFNKLLGYEGSELKGKTPADFTHPDDASAELEMVREVRAGKRDSYRMEKRYFTKSGECKWVDVSVSALRDSRGEPENFVAVVIDITDRKSAAARLRANEERLELALQGGGLGTWDLDVQTGEYLFNTRWAEMIGYTPDELEHTLDQWKRLLHPDDHARVVATLNAHLEGRTPYYEAEYRLACKSCGWVWVLSKGRVIERSAEGKAIRACGTHLDVTKRKQFESRLRESEQRFRQVIQLSPVGIFLGKVEEDGSLILSGGNGAADAMLGFPHSERVGERIEHVFPTFAGHEIVEHFRRTARDGTPFDVPEFEYSDENVSGVYDLHVFQTSPGNVGVMFTDLSERKRIEAERREFEHRLQQAQKLESLGVLAGGIAHDFSNILMAVMGNLDLVQERLPEDSEAKMFVAEADQAIQRAAHLTEQMLAYSGKGHFLIQRTNLNETLLGMIDLLNAPLPEGSSLQLEKGDGLPFIQADAAQLKQLAMNLVTNAAEALNGTDSGCVRLTTGSTFCDRDYLDFLSAQSPAAVEKNLPEGRYAYLEVEDNGCGMDAEALSKVFDPFFSTKFAGRGLGMAAVSGIVRGHKGAIEVRSEPGHGTTCRVLFPAFDEEVATRPKEAAARPGGAPAQDREPTLLVVDDEDQVRVLAQNMIERLGFRVLCASGGQEALDIFEKEGGGIDVVLLDLNMPEMSGQETLRELKRLDPGVNVIVTSGYDEGEMAEQLTNDDVRGFVQKPYRLGKLKTLLAAILDS